MLDAFARILTMQWRKNTHPKRVRILTQLLIAGSVNIGVCSFKHHIIHGVRWLEADGMVTVLLSFFPLFNDMIFPEVIPFFFGVWELVSGVFKLSDTAELKQLR